MRIRRIAKVAAFRVNPVVLVGVLVFLTAVVAAPVFSIRSEASANKSAAGSARVSTSRAGVATVSNPASLLPWSNLFAAPLPLPPVGPTVATFEHNGKGRG